MVLALKSKEYSIHRVDPTPENKYGLDMEIIKEISILTKISVETIKKRCIRLIMYTNETPEQEAERKKKEADRKKMKGINTIPILRPKLMIIGLT